MSSKLPPVPEEQRALRDSGDARQAQVDGEPHDQKGDADLNLEQQGRYGNLHQNVETVHAKVQDR